MRAPFAPSPTRCRSCRVGRVEVVLDLGSLPLANGLVDPARAPATDARFPLAVGLCETCGLVQVVDPLDPSTLFTLDYPYASSYADGVVEHAATLADALVARRRLDSESLVVEIASNDGALLRHFVERGIPALGIDPAAGQAATARARGVETIVAFFDEAVADGIVAERGRAHVVVANNVLGHVPDPNVLVRGVARLLADGGVAVFEAPYVRDLVAGGAFDTIYHEHYSYLSVRAVDALVARHGLVLQDVEHFPGLHGGSLRWWVATGGEPSEAVRGLLAEEASLGLATPSAYASLRADAARITGELRQAVTEIRRRGGRVAAYGAAAKGTVLLNVAGLGADTIEYVVDRNPRKHGLLVPGVRVPVVGTDALASRPPDYLVVLAWNHRDEILRQQSAFADHGGRFVVPVPRLEIV